MIRYYIHLNYTIFYSHLRVFTLQFNSLIQIYLRKLVLTRGRAIDALSVRLVIRKIYSILNWLIELWAARGCYRLWTLSSKASRRWWPLALSTFILRAIMRLVAATAMQLVFYFSDDRLIINKYILIYIHTSVYEVLSNDNYCVSPILIYYTYICMRFIIFLFVIINFVAKRRCVT